MLVFVDARFEIGSNTDVQDPASASQDVDEIAHEISGSPDLIIPTEADGSHAVCGAQARPSA
jgi:hypothetical protein